MMHAVRQQPATPPSTPVAVDGLYAIVYVSTAARALSLAELQHLHRQAQQRNACEGLSGVLLYADGAFMQYLEGPAPALARVYEAIRLHPWHYGVIDLLREPIRARAFAGWSMAFQVVGAAAPDEQDAQLARRLAEPLQHGSAACTLLSSFWRSGRSALAETLQAVSQNRQRHMARARHGAAASAGTTEYA